MRSSAMTGGIMSHIVLMSLVLIVTTLVATGKSHYGRTRGCNPRCQQECIEVLNTYRTNHDAPNLTFSQDLANEAQSWADGGQFGYDMNLRGKYGQLIEWDVKNELPSFTAVVKHWHDKEKEYDFQEGKSNNGKTLHDFTQVVWKKAMHVGCGLGKLFGARYYVVWMDADGVVSPNLGIGRESIGDPKQEDVNWFEESLRHNTHTTLGNTTGEGRDTMNEDGQTETIDDITTSTDDIEEKVLNIKAQKIKSVPTLSRSAQSVMIDRDQDAKAKTIKISPPTKQISRDSNGLIAERNRSRIANQDNHNGQKMELQSVQNYEQKNRGNKTNELDYDPMFLRKERGSLYARLRVASKGFTSSEKNEDGDDIQDVSSEVKTAYSGKEGLSNSDSENNLAVPLHQFPSDDNSNSLESGYQGRAVQKEVLDPESAVLQRLVDGSSEEIKLNNERDISQVGGPITSISAVGVPVSYFRERSAFSADVLKLNSSNVKANEKTPVAANDSSLILEKKKNEKSNTTKQFPYSQLKNSGNTKVAREPQLSSRQEQYDSTTGSSHMILGINEATDLTGKTQGIQLAENTQMSTTSEGISSTAGQNHSMITPSIDKNVFASNVTADKSLETGNNIKNIGAQNEKGTEWNTISETGKLNFSLKFPFEKNTSIESADHLIRLNVSGAAHRETVVKPTTDHPSIELSNPNFRETEASDRRTTKLEPPPIPLNIAAVTARCRDVTDHCRLWAQHGQCKDVTYMEYMREHCKHTCGYCGLPEVIFESELPVHRQSLLDKKVCEDSREHQFSCPLWSYHGYCEKRQRLMELYCRKSCDLCGETSTMPSFTQDTSKLRALARTMPKVATSGHVTPLKPILHNDNEMEKNPMEANEENTSNGATESLTYGMSGTDGNVGTSKVNDGELVSRYSWTDDGTKRNENMILDNDDVGVTRRTEGSRHLASALREQTILPPGRKEVVKGHTKSVSTTGCDTSCQNECLQAHNAYRFNHGASSLRLSQRLSDQAQTWANRKVFKHSPWASGQGGESIALGGLYPSFTAAVKAWHDEERDYDWSTGEARGQANVAHFTQVVWKKATLLGCGRSLVNNEPFYIAQMDIPGVVTGDLPGYGRDNIGTPLKDDTNWFMESSPYWKELQEKNSIPAGVDHYIL